MAAAPAPVAEADAAPKKGKKKLIIILAAVLLVVLAGGGAAVFMLVNPSVSRRLASRCRLKTPGSPMKSSSTCLQCAMAC
jgi:flagellar basal body-associated protein FliL